VRRIAKTCSKLGIIPYCIYSEADKNSLFIKYCKDGVNIGGFAPADSYLRMDKIVNVA